MAAIDNRREIKFGHNTDDLYKEVVNFFNKYNVNQIIDEKIMMQIRHKELAIFYKGRKMLKITNSRGKNLNVDFPWAKGYDQTNKSMIDSSVKKFKEDINTNKKITTKHEDMLSAIKDMLNSFLGENNADGNKSKIEDKIQQKIVCTIENDNANSLIPIDVEFQFHGKNSDGLLKTIYGRKDMLMLQDVGNGEFVPVILELKPNAKSIGFNEIQSDEDPIVETEKNASDDPDEDQTDATIHGHYIKTKRLLNNTTMMGMFLDYLRKIIITKKNIGLISKGHKLWNDNIKIKNNDAYFAIVIANHIENENWNNLDKNINKIIQENDKNGINVKIVLLKKDNFHFSPDDIKEVSIKN